MENRDLISIIVPIAGWQANLDKCLASLSLQTYKNLEIICINTSLENGVSDILDGYAGADSRFVIINKNDINAFDLRNIGFSVAKGDFISFINSSDSVSLCLYQKFINLTSKPDIFVFNGWECENKGIYPKQFFSINEWKNHRGDDTFHDFSDMINPFRGKNLVVNKIYKTEFLKSVVQRSLSAKLFEYGLFNELFFFFITMITASSIVVNPDPLYYSYESLSKSYNTGIINVFDIFKVMDKIENLLRKTNRYDMYKYAFFQYKYQKYAHLFFKAKENELEEFYAEMKRRLEAYKHEDMNWSICERLVLFGVYKNILKLNFKEFYEKYKDKI